MAVASLFAYYYYRVVVYWFRSSALRDDGMPVITSTSLVVWAENNDRNNGALSIQLRKTTSIAAAVIGQPSNNNRNKKGINNVTSIVIRYIDFIVQKSSTEAIKPSCCALFIVAVTIVKVVISARRTRTDWTILYVSRIRACTRAGRAGGGGTHKSMKARRHKNIIQTEARNGQWGYR